jgi:predicted TIM-barrel fold metal-dependent hydrolase
MIIDCHNHLGVDLMFYLRGEFPYAQDICRMAHEGAAAGVDRWIVFPLVTNLSLDFEMMRQGKIGFPGGSERVPYAFENRRTLTEVYQLCPGQGRLTIPFVMVDPMRATAEQAEELRKLRAEFKFYGLKIQSTVIQSDIKCLNRQGKIFVELAEEWDIPFLIHSSVYVNDLWAQASDILDIAETNSRVRFCLAHSCRFDRVCLDRLNTLPNAWFDCSAHCIHCDAAVKEMEIIAPPARRFSSDYRDPARVVADLAAAYPRKMMWGSDSPFYTYVGQFGDGLLSLLSTYKRETAALKSQPAAVIQKIAWQNTLDFLKLKDESILLAG